ncbi:M48 family metalloprotease [Desulfococcaceae bacterium HSG8]|nr:M48 family metalloprotease [Desulfococcaceae bacterium HSG8]
MFTNLIYFIAILLIYNTYQPSEDTVLPVFETLTLFLSLILIFAGLTRFQFQRLERRAVRDSFFSLDRKFDAILTRQLVMAVIVFFADIHLLHLPSLLMRIPAFSVFPTFCALVSLGIAIFYLAFIWACAHGPYHKLYNVADHPLQKSLGAGDFRQLGNESAGTVFRSDNSVPVPVIKKNDEFSIGSYVTSNISFSIPVILLWLLISGIKDAITLLPFDFPKHFLASTEGELISFHIILLGVVIAGPLLVRIAWRCKPVEAGYARRQIEDLCTKAGLKYANIFYWPLFGGKMITAAVMGLVKNFRYILVTDALLTQLRPEEVDAVIAHEIGHVKRRHLLYFFLGFYLFSISLVPLLTFLELSIYSAAMGMEPIFRLMSSLELRRDAVLPVISNIIFIIIFLLYFRYIFGYFMRNFERQADTYIYTLFESARPLISTFEKIVLTTGQPPDKPNWHHFSIAERIEYLKKCESDKTWISRQDRKVRNSIAAYVVGIVLTGVIGYHLSFGEIGEKIGRHLFEKAVLMEEKAIREKIEKNPAKAELYSHLGDICYSRKDYECTISAYEKSVDIRPDDPHVLNNLAWLYATCEDETFRNPEEALMLATAAAERMPVPHILDTLAESYYINGRFGEAVSAEKNALEQVSENRSYFEGQLERFLKAAGNEQEP